MTDRPAVTAAALATALGPAAVVPPVAAPVAAESLGALDARVRHDLALLTLPAPRWVPDRAMAAPGQPVTITAETPRGGGSGQRPRISPPTPPARSI